MLNTLFFAANRALRRALLGVDELRSRLLLEALPDVALARVQPALRATDELVRTELIERVNYPAIGVSRRTARRRKERPGLTAILLQPSSGGPRR